MRLFFFLSSFFYCLFIYAQGSPILWEPELNSAEGLPHQNFNPSIFCDSDDWVRISFTKGIPSDGNKDAATIRLMVLSFLSPLWEQTWFIVLLSVLLFGLQAIWFRHRINKAQEKAQLKTRIVENKMSALAAQMSPHFIFNSLQSVNRFILKQDRKVASEYLGRFSKLIRMMLDNSRKNEHPIAKEIDFLQLYLTVESQRFKTPFDFNITIDQQIDTFETTLPTMVLQPFIENAIWHGISHKKGQGKITLTIDKRADILKCVIEDNGVGRVMAKELSIKKEHPFRALEIMEERLRLLFPAQQDRCKILYVDLKDTNNHLPCGTRVIITLPTRG